MTTTTTASDLVVAEGLAKSYGATAAVDGVDLRIAAGTTLGLVGESGCGKSTTGRVLLALERPDAGRVTVAGSAVGDLGPRELRALRRRMQPVFQDPADALNARLTVEAIVAEPLRAHGLDDDLPGRVRGLLDSVSLDPALATRRPGELSGGQRQRVAIARALAVDPDFLVCDEPVSALDVSVQAQVVNLLRRLQEERGLTYLFISHDLAIVRTLATRVAVMYAGRVVEEGDTEDLFGRPRHPYTRLLLDAAPRPRVTDRSHTGAEGRAPAGAAREGCAFAPRCPLARARCRTETPPLRDVGAGRRSACHFAEEVR